MSSIRVAEVRIDGVRDCRLRQHIENETKDALNEAFARGELALEIGADGMGEKLREIATVGRDYATNVLESEGKGSGDFISKFDVFFLEYADEPPLLH